MTQIIRTLVPVLASAFLMGAAAAQALTPPQDTATSAVQNVDLITLEGQKQMLANPGTEPVGARQPDVTIVEYFDYNCPYCKTVVPTLRALLAQDPKVALVYKDWPVLGPVSTYAAASALAAGWQGKYLAAHDALIGGPRLAQNEQVDSILKKVGVDMDRLKKDRTAHAKEIAALLARNDAEAHALTLDGTPGFVVGLQLVPGVANLNFLKQLLANSRQGLDLPQGSRQSK
ncbi:MAG TPA: DsbA family protein [Steroidobacteraceae bacterium]|jgi:protein-disulfide isomerase|nr:DsbA family protein [Steroidobacteraceae bacterium]